MKLLRKDIAVVIENLLCSSEVRKVTKFVAPDFIVRATRQLKGTKRDKSTTVLFTFGKPNFRERQFVKACKKAGEPFPVRKVQLKFWPKK